MKDKTEKIVLVCKKCGWQWTPKNPNKKPRSCPYCKSYYWETGKAKFNQKLFAKK